MDERPKPILNLEQLEALRSLNEPGQPDIIASLIAIFLKQTPALIKSLREAAQKKDLETAKSFVHKLKGSCANIGAQELADFCQMIEDNWLQPSAQDLSGSLEMLEKKYRQTAEALQKFSRMQEITETER